MIKNSIIASLAFLVTGICFAESVVSSGPAPSCSIAVATEDQGQNLVFAVKMNDETVKTYRDLHFARNYYDSLIAQSRCLEVPREKLPSCVQKANKIELENFDLLLPLDLPYQLNDFLGGTLQSFYAARICKNPNL